MDSLKTVEKALRIIDELLDRPLNATDIANVLKMNRTVVHRQLLTLQNSGYLIRIGEVYYPGPKFVRFSELTEPDLMHRLNPIMRDLSALVGETIILTIPDRLEAIGIGSVLGRIYPVRVEYEVGVRRPIWLGASGRAILAFSDESVIEAASQSAPDPEALQVQLEEIRDKGYSVSSDELKQGIAGIAAPIIDPINGAFASLSIVVPLVRADNIERFVPQLLDAIAHVRK